MQLSGGDLRKILSLSGGQILLLSLMDVGIFLLVHFNLILFKFTQGTVLANTDVQDSFGAQISAFTDSKFINLATLILFWAGVGLVAYSIIYSIYSVYSEARNEVVVEQEYVNRGDPKARLRAPIIQAGLLAGIIVLGLITLKFLYPLWLTLFANFVLTVSQTPLTAIAALLGALVGAFVNLYAFKVLISAIVVLE